MEKIDISEYKYKYELHMHTSDASACGHATGDEMAKAYKAGGYAGIVITDHAWGGNTCVDRSLPWEEWVDRFCVGYDKAREWGDANDFTVLFGLETGFNGTEFLIYGISPKELRNTPMLWDASIPEQFDIIHKLGGIVIQAHPFREEFYIPEIRLFPEYVDGAEGVNATHSSHLSKSHFNPIWNDRAIEYSKKHGFPMTAGSDNHTTSLLGGGIMTRQKLCTSKDLTDLIMSDKMYLLTDGDRVYDRYGVLLEGNI